MEVTCIHRQGSKVPKEALDLGNTTHAVFDLTYGKRYRVYGINVSKGIISYLIVEDGKPDRPCWKPACLFEVTDNRLPSTWSFAYWGDKPDFLVQGMLGYPELTEDDGKHNDDLLEREEVALALFEERRNEIDSELAE
jgi:hypothetical protein